LPSAEDRIVVHPRVLATIASLAALSVPGVARLRSRRLAFPLRLLWPMAGRAVRLRVDDHAVFVDLHLILNAGYSLLEASRKVQEAVARTIEEMTDMRVLQVNVHIEGVRSATYS